MTPEKHFGFGANWAGFLGVVDEARLEIARQSLIDCLQSADLHGLRFLDLGSGSGIFSLAARRLGSTVHSFDYDRDSVRCTETLKEQHFPGDPNWTVEAGSVLDDSYLQRLGSFDIVYAWGVLHHTGDLWNAFGNTIGRVAPGGRLVVALYNDQGWLSRWWTWVKRSYNFRPYTRPAWILLYSPFFIGLRWLLHRVTGRDRERGMSLWYDMIDWLGGWPFEVAKPSTVKNFAVARGLRLVRERTVGRRSGCNEFVFERPAS